MTTSTTPNPTSPRPLRLGTRASELATAQSTWVADQLRARGHEVELVLVQTEGDQSSAPLTQIGGTGVFVSALREALLGGEVDLAVHSLKDLPVGEEPGLTLAAVPVREDPRDVLVSRDRIPLADLPEGATIGTGSPRRAVQLAVAAPAATVTDIRGNVGRRIAQVTDGHLDAIVLAAAGLRRVGRIDEATEVLGTDVMLPAPGQGALAVECRYGDAETTELLVGLDDAPTRGCVTAERALLGALEAGCSAPIGALARVEDEGYVLEATVADGRGTVLRHTVRGPRPSDLGQEMAHYFLQHVDPELFPARTRTPTHPADPDVPPSGPADQNPTTPAAHPGA